DEPGRDELHVVDAAHGSDAPADQCTEDHEIERGGDRRRHDRLAPDADDPLEFPPDDRLESDPARVRGVRQGRRRRCGPGGGGSRVAHGRAPWRPSTRRMKISSSRFTLLRIDTTSMPWDARRTKIPFRLCSFDT